MGHENPDWLPAGWEVCVKVRSYGRKDKYYVNTSNGLKFNSKPEVLRYLKSAVKRNEPKINITRTAPENLPPGWIKEIRERKKGGKIRKDPYYIDPVSGSHFRSMQEVLRYLETKDSGKIEVKPEDKDHISADLKDHSQSSSAEAKRQRLVIKKADKMPTKKKTVKSDDNHVEQREEDNPLPNKLQPVNSGEQPADRMRDNKEVTTRTLRSGTKVVALRKVDAPEANCAEHSDNKYDSMASHPPNKLPKVNGKEQQEGGENKSTRLGRTKATGDESLKSGSKDTAVKSISVPGTSNLEQQQERNISVSENAARLKKRKKLTSDLPRRTSKRLAQTEIDPSLDLKTSNEVGPANEPTGKAEVSTVKNSGHDRLSDDPETNATGKFDSFNESNENPTKSRTENPTSNKQKEPATLFPENISRVEEHKGVDIKEEEKHEKQLDSSLEDLLMDPCFEFAIKTLTGAIPIEDVSRIGDGLVTSLTSNSQPSQSSSALPSDDIWDDPCFEFAVKTLTGDMPFQNGSSLQLPPSPSEASGSKNLASPKFRLDDLHPLASFNHFGAETKDYATQQDVKDLPLPHSVKGSSQNFVDSSPHTGVEGRRNCV